MEDFNENPGQDLAAPALNLEESVAELEHLYRTLPMIEAFREVRHRIADILVNLQKGSADVLDAQKMIITAETSYRVIRDGQDERFNLFLEREARERHSMQKKSN